MAAVSLGGGAVVAARARRRRRRTVRGIRREPSDLILQPANAVIVGWLRERAHLNPHGRYLPIAHPDLDDVLEALAAGIDHELDLIYGAPVLSRNRVIFGLAISFDIAFREPPGGFSGDVPAPLADHHLPPGWVAHKASRADEAAGRERCREAAAAA